MSEKEALDEAFQFRDWEAVTALQDEARPPVQVTDEMVERGALALATGRFGVQYEPTTDDREKARDVLKAALNSEATRA